MQAFFPFHLSLVLMTCDIFGEHYSTLCLAHTQHVKNGNLDDETHCYFFLGLHNKSHWANQVVVLKFYLIAVLTSINSSVGLDMYC